MDSQRVERRRKPRVRAGLAAQLSDSSGSSALAAETMNLSMAGVCCRLPTPIQPLTRVKVTLLVPDPSSKKRTKTSVVTTEAVVVRNDERASERGSKEYEIACAFTFLGDKERKILQTYVEHRLTETSALTPSE